MGMEELDYIECDNCGDVFHIEDLNEVENHYLCNLCLAELENDLGIS